MPVGALKRAEVLPVLVVVEDLHVVMQRLHICAGRFT